ncbi:MAG TPA: glycosyltransferase family 1 protein [Gemmatimonadaceae bacterium]|nr:glycosyltransferase family 1 protein [Gemmatimonadaceae bacterium]
MKRIGVLLTARPVGGAFQYTQAILEAALELPRDRYSIVLAYSDPSWLDVIRDRARAFRLNDSLWSRLLNRIWHEARLPVSAWRKFAAPFDSNMRTLVAERCDLWICPNHDRYAFRAEIPALGTVHDLMHRYEPSYSEVSENGEYAAREFHFSETCRWSKGILVDSRVGKEQVQASYGVPPGKVFVLPYIAPGYIYDHDAAADAGLEQCYSLPSKYFFYPAQFYTHKNHRALIAALARMRESHPDVKLVLVGLKERNGFPIVQQLVEENGLGDNVLFLGYVPDTDIPGLYRRARALVMPTFFGPTNIPQLEAFAMGCPVATSRIYGIPEQVGDAALLFDPHSVDEIHECMVRLWTDDRLCATLAERGRKHAREWGPPQFRDRLLEVVEALT